MSVEIPGHRGRRSQLMVVLASLVLVLSLGGCGLVGGGDRSLTVHLADSAGLFVGNDVGVLGVKVGQVSSIEPEAEQVVVEIEITDDDLKIPADANAAVVARSVATDRYIELTPVFDGGAQMKDGATIPVERTVTPVDFDKVLASLDKLATGLVDNPRATNSLKDLVAITAKNLDGRGAQINRTIRSLSTATRTFTSQSDNAVATMKSLDRLTSKLAGNEQTVRRFITQVAVASALLASERKNIGSALRALSAAVDDLNAFVKQHRGRINSSLDDAAVVLANAVKGRRDLAEILEELPLASDNVARTRNPNNNNLRVRAQLTQAIPAVDDLLGTLCAELDIGRFCDSLSVPPDLGTLLEGLTGGGGPR